MKNGITIQSLVKTYRGGLVRALDGLHAHLLPGRTHGLIGPNGSGKTTLMGCLLGLLKRDSGSIDIDGLQPENIPFKAVLGYVPERLRFDMWMRAWDFMEYHDTLTLQKPEGRKDRITRALTRIGLDQNFWRERLKTFSRGMLQRIGLAQALLNQPQYLFLDEPTSGMDPSGVMLFRKIIAEESQRGCLVLLSSHQLNQVERLCDEIHFIEKGRLIRAQIQAADKSKRILCLRWSPPPKKLKLPKTRAKSKNFRLVELRKDEALYEVKGDEGAREVIRLLVKEGYPVFEAVPDSSRLERYFTSPKEAAHD
jgi:ABC-2 type transport system ATP-binding protein